MKNKNILKFKTYLPVFKGFHNTKFDVDETKIRDKMFIGATSELVFDHERYQENMSKVLVNHMSNKFKEKNLLDKIVFESVESPAMYNDKNNDSINIEIQITKDQLINVEYSLELVINEFNLFLQRESKTGVYHKFSTDGRYWIHCLDYLIEEGKSDDDFLLGFILEFLWEFLISFIDTLFEDLDTWYYQYVGECIVNKEQMEAESKYATLEKAMVITKTKESIEAVRKQRMIVEELQFKNM